MNNFTVMSCDTDSLTICKQDQSGFSNEEIEALTNNLNSIYPELIRWEFEFYIPTFIVLKAKNYIQWDGKKVKYKGSALKNAKLEPALKEFQKEIIDSIIFDKHNYVEIYNKYIKEIQNIVDIKRWCSKKSISKTTMESTRANETRVIAALRGRDFSEGDRIYVFYEGKDTLCLAEDFKNEYDMDRMFEKLYKTAQVFATILDVDKYFLNYKLKKNKKLLEGNI